MSIGSNVPLLWRKIKRNAPIASRQKVAVKTNAPDGEEVTKGGRAGGCFDLENLERKQKSIGTLRALQI